MMTGSKISIPYIEGIPPSNMSSEGSMMPIPIFQSKC